MSKTGKRWLLSIHLLFSAIMFGVAIVFHILSITAANTNDEALLKACYSSMYVLADSAVRYPTIATLVTGILLSVLTHWGLFKFYWIIAKEALMIVAIILGPFGMNFWTLKAFTLTSAEGLDALHNPAFTLNSEQLWIGIVLQIISLTAIYLISVFKPWGPRKRGATTVQSERSKK